MNLQYRLIQCPSQAGRCAHCDIPILVGERAIVKHPDSLKMFCSLVCIQGRYYRRRPGFRSKAVEKSVAR